MSSVLEALSLSRMLAHQFCMAIRQAVSFALAVSMSGVDNSK
jgi:hypothetical protein